MKISLLQSLFKKTTRVDKSYIRYLLEMAIVDGHLDERENDLLVKIARKNNLTKAEIESLKEIENSNDLLIPDDEFEKFSQFYNLVQMMIADDRIHSEEWKLCQSFGKRLGYQWSNLDELIYLVSEHISKGSSVKDTLKEVESILK